MFIVHKSVTSWRIFISDAELSTFTIEQECCLGLIKFWPNTLYRFFRFWIGVMKGQLGPPVIEIAIRNSLKRKLPTPAFQLAVSNLRRHSQLALFRLSWHDAYFAARQILWLVTPLLNFLLSNRLAPYKAGGRGLWPAKAKRKILISTQQANNVLFHNLRLS